jgi:hypothetical protein
MNFVFFEAKEGDDSNLLYTGRHLSGWGKNKNFLSSRKREKPKKSKGNSLRQDPSKEVDYGLYEIIDQYHHDQYRHDQYLLDEEDFSSEPKYSDSEESGQTYNPSNGRPRYYTESDDESQNGRDYDSDDESENGRDYDSDNESD